MAVLAAAGVCGGEHQEKPRELRGKIDGSLVGDAVEGKRERRLGDRRKAAGRGIPRSAVRGRRTGLGGLLTNSPAAAVTPKPSALSLARARRSSSVPG